MILDNISSLIKLESSLRCKVAKAAGSAAELFDPFMVLHCYSDGGKYYKKVSDDHVVTDQDDLAFLKSLGEIKSEGSPAFSSYPRDIDGSQPLEFLKKFEAAREYIRKSKYLNSLYEGFVLKVVPLKTTSHLYGRGSSVEPLRGVLFAGLSEHEPSELVLATTIVHELAHHVMSALTSSDRLADENEYIHSPIRGENRPATMTLHALAALVFSVLILKEVGFIEPEGDRTRKELIKYFFDLGEKTAISLENASLTKVGQIVFGELKEMLGRE